MKKEQQNHSMYELCQKHMHAYVLAEMVDGMKIDGIVTGLDEEYVYFAVPMDAQEMSPKSQGSHERQFGGYGFGGGGGYGYGYPQYYGHQGYGGYPRPRFQRLVLPLTALAALSLLPWY